MNIEANIFFCFIAIRQLVRVSIISRFLLLTSFFTFSVLLSVHQYPQFILILLSEVTLWFHKVSFGFIELFYTMQYIVVELQGLNHLTYSSGCYPSWNHFVARWGRTYFVSTLLFYGSNIKLISCTLFFIIMLILHFILIFQLFLTHLSFSFKSFIFFLVYLSKGCILQLKC